MLNILIRTSRRPKGFTRVMDELTRQSQTVETNIIVSADNDETLAYVEAQPGVDHVVKCVAKERLNADHNPYNEYYNQMIPHTKPGWIWRIDDDDIIMPEALKNIEASVSDPDTCYIFNMLSHNNVIIPRNRERITYCDIATPNFILHTKHNDLCQWKPVRGGDYRYLKDVLHTNPLLKLRYVDRIIYKVDTQSYGDQDEVVLRSDYYAEVLLKAFRSGKTWVLEMGGEEGQRDLCFRLSSVLRGLEQQVVMLDTTALTKQELLRILLSISADYYLVSDPDSMIYLGDDQGEFLFEMVNAQLLFFHWSHMTGSSQTVRKMAQRVHAFRRIARRSCHLCFSEAVEDELRKIEVGAVGRLLPIRLGSRVVPSVKTDTPSASVEQTMERIIDLFQLPVKMPNRFSKDLDNLKQLMESGTKKEVGDTIQTLVNKYRSPNELRAVADVLRKHRLESQAFLCYFEVLRMDPEDAEALGMLEKLGQREPSRINLRAARDLQQLLKGANVGS